VLLFGVIFVPLMPNDPNPPRGAQVCPADWQPGAKTMVADPVRSLDYFATLREVRFAFVEGGRVGPRGWLGPKRSRAAQTFIKTLTHQPHHTSHITTTQQTKKADAGDDYRGIADVATRKEFDALISGDKPTVVDFMASWCGKCRMIAPFVSELAARHPDLVSARARALCLCLFVCVFVCV
jgi:thiol-disulfide isomerase/thioredoxin